MKSAIWRLCVSVNVQDSFVFKQVSSGPDQDLFINLHVFIFYKNTRHYNCIQLHLLPLVVHNFHHFRAVTARHHEISSIPLCRDGCQEKHSAALRFLAAVVEACINSDRCLHWRSVSNGFWLLSLKLFTSFSTKEVKTVNYKFKFECIWDFQPLWAHKHVTLEGWRKDMQ